MNTLDSIAGRRSIRRFRPDPIPEDSLRCILSAGIQAPSGKNRQPWRFVVVGGEQRAEMVRIMRAEIEHEKAEGASVGSAEPSAAVMEQAPVTVFVINPTGAPPWVEHSTGETFRDVVDIQSAGAAIENMLLAAQALGLGSLWICDVFIAYEQLLAWLGEEGELIAAVSFGFSDEQPPARPRKPFGEVVRWR